MVSQLGTPDIRARRVFAVGAVLLIGYSSVPSLWLPLDAPGCVQIVPDVWKEGEKIAPCWEPLVKMTCFPWLEGWTLDPDPPSLEFHSCWVKQSIHVWRWLIKNAMSWRDCFGPPSCSLDVQDALTSGFLRTLSFLPVFLQFCESSYMLQFTSSLLKLIWISFWWKTLND